MEVMMREVGNILTRTSGFLKTVTSHSLQPYLGCSFGNSLCGVGCYVQHNRFITKGRLWGGFLEIRTNAASSYRKHWEREVKWARRSRGQFGVFLSSSTEPFLPQEFQYGITRSILEAMLDCPPDLLIIQTHSHRVVDYLEYYRALSRLCQVRIHISIETDMVSLPGLPPHASSVNRRFDAASRLQSSDLFTVITVSPLLPIRDPEHFFRRIGEVANRVVIDHFIQGDGTSNGARTMKTSLPDVMEEVRAHSTSLQYRERILQVALKHLPGRVGVSINGFAGRYLTTSR